MTTCPDFDAWEALADGSAAPEDRTSLQRHLQGCADCRIVYDGVRANDALLGPLREALSTGDEDLPQAVAPPALEGGARIGAYRVVRRIGRGGMGEVYLAAREEGGFSQRVAIKVLRSGADTDTVLRRFQLEQQVLAALNHPNIARLFEGGRTADGRPYLVMEYVEGLPLGAFADEHRLSVPERLQLFAGVCKAVHHAHRNLVIHRDLKPSNIIVNADGEPKLLDFGIAKIINPMVSDLLAEPTTAGFNVMTPEYASPEQVRGDPLGTSSDIYSLGVILYELVCGHRPYHIRRRAAVEIARVVCEEDPQRPSTAAGRSEVIEYGGPEPRSEEITPERVSTMRETRPDRLRRRLEGDIDNIVMKALRKEPQRRYASAEQFADDIDRHLRGLPVAACPDTMRYRATKFVRRHRVGVSAVAIITLLLIAGTAGTTSGWQSAEARADESRRVIESMCRLADTLVNDVHDSVKLLDGAIPARRELIDASLTYLDDLRREGRDDEDVLMLVARGYARTGDLELGMHDPGSGTVGAALDHYREALAVYESLEGRVSDPQRLDARRSDTHRRIGDAHRRSGQPGLALQHYTRSLTQREAAHARDPDPDNTKRLYVIVENIAEARDSLGEIDAALALTERSMKLRRDLVAIESSAAARRGLSVGLLRLAQRYAALARLDEAVGAAREAVRIRETLERADPDSTRTRRDLAFARMALAEYLLAVDHDDALGAIDGAVHRLARLVRDNPEDDRSRFTLAGAQTLKARILYDDDPATARALLAEAVRILQSLATADPDDATYRRHLAIAHIRIAQFSGDEQTAAAHLDVAETTLATLGGDDDRVVELRDWIARLREG